VNVLITSASRKVALVRAFQAALAAVGEGRVVAGDMSPLSAALYLADDAVLLPTSESPGFLGEVLEVCARHEVRVLVPTRDEELPLFAEAAKRFDDAGVIVVVSPPDVVRTCQDKGAFLTFCDEYGFATPSLVRVSDPSAIDYPVFVRPRVGKGGRGAVRANDHTALELALKNVQAPIVQTFIDKPEFTLDVFADFSSRVISVVPRERIVVSGGESVVSRTLHDARLIERGRDLVEALGCFGHVTAQCFYGGVGDEPSFIEVNPRYGGAAYLGFAAGHPTPEYLVRIVSGDHVPEQLGGFEDGLTMLRHSVDLLLSADDIIGG
jgi:carbamoyl-phosphate synthase large subunit